MAVVAAGMHCPPAAHCARALRRRRLGTAIRRHPAQTIEMVMLRVHSGKHTFPLFMNGVLRDAASGSECLED
jgi:hypothetical protein